MSAAEQLAELNRQADVLVARGYPALAGLPDDGFRSLARRLEALLPAAPFVLVVSGALVPPMHLIQHVVLDGKPGFTTMPDDDIARFVPTADLSIPDAPVYLAADVDTGQQTLGVRPDDALAMIHAAGRTPLTLNEGLAVAVQHPEWLRERNCFEMLGSRAGDKRVTGLWLSNGAPRLGWCWGGNPHTWLGMASAARRIG
jgi:hypothetical protein